MLSDTTKIENFVPTNTKDFRDYIMNCRQTGLCSYKTKNFLSLETDPQIRKTEFSFESLAAVSRIILLTGINEELGL